jgi:hypothetical protein
MIQAQAAPSANSGNIEVKASDLSLVSQPDEITRLTWKPPDRPPSRRAPLCTGCSPTCIRNKPTAPASPWQHSFTARGVTAAGSSTSI